MNIRKRRLKVILGATMLSSIVVIPTITLASCGSQVETLTAKGSSTVLPFISAFAKKYDGAEIQVAGGGSGEGQKSIISGQVDFGDMSATPDAKEIIGSEKFRTVTIGVDGLSLVVKGRKDNKPVDILNILDIFTEAKGSTKWLKAAKEIFGNDATLANVDVLSRENPNKSGTAEIFGIGLGELSSTDQTKISHHPKPSELKGVTGTTNEANTEAFKTLSGSNKKYAITYLSLGVADVLIKGKNNFSKLSLTNGTKEMIPLKENVGKTYNWARSLNVIYNTKSKNKEEIIKFVEGMLTEGQELLPQVGYLKLSKEQLKNEGIDSINDKELYESNKINNKNGLAIKIRW